MKLSVMYRGPLSSCNYACGYCPFAKRNETAKQLVRDRHALTRFVNWLRNQSMHSWRLLFTPWGEALVRPWYREAISALSHLPHIERVSVQTNLSCNLGWIDDCRRDRLAFWATFHPTEIVMNSFLEKVRQVREQQVRLSVGMVGVPDQIDAIVNLRRQLPADVYLWINAQQPRQRPYSEAEVAILSEIDPQFQLTLNRRPSRDKPCRTGESTFTVDGDGNMRRCHFVDEVIGNIHQPDWSTALQPRPCPNRFCNCYLGTTQLQSVSQEGFLRDSLQAW